VPVHVCKRKGRLKPATTAEFLLIASGSDVKIPLSVLDLAPSTSLHGDARIHAKRGHPTARRVEQRRRRSVGEIVPASATRIAPARPSLHEPGARRPQSANHCDSQRSLPAAGRSSQFILFLLTNASRQPFLELPSSTGEPRHDRSSRNLRDVGYLLVREIFLVSQRQDLTQLRRQFIHCFPN
jgi:hypothetical protein